uniref:Uncharacterized protein n=1 Tax=Anguilla anguilla TaxID=7936 RepID=A0A0E9QKR9_ANGAN
MSQFEPYTPTLVHLQIGSQENVSYRDMNCQSCGHQEVQLKCQTLV